MTPDEVKALIAEARAAVDYLNGVEKHRLDKRHPRPEVPSALRRSPDAIQSLYVRLADALEAATSPLPDEQLDEIEKRANAAAEWGGWAIWEDLRDDGFVHVGNLDGVIPDGQIATGEDAEPNPVARCFTREIAEHIVSMDPDRTLALLAEVRRLRAQPERAPSRDLLTEDITRFLLAEFGQPVAWVEDELGTLQEWIAVVGDARKVAEALVGRFDRALSSHPDEETEWERGWRDGWFSSGEGFNGEWPDEGKTWEKSAGYQEFRRQNPVPEGSGS